MQLGVDTRPTTTHETDHRRRRPAELERRVRMPSFPDLFNKRRPGLSVSLQLH